MNPADPVIDYRAVALKAAVRYIATKAMPTTPQHVLAVAEQFHRYLLTGEVQ